MAGGVSLLGAWRMISLTELACLENDIAGRIGEHWCERDWPSHLERGAIGQAPLEWASATQYLCIHFLLLRLR